MHGRGNYTTQVGQDQHAPPPAFHHYGQPQAIQPGQPSVHFTPGILAYQHTPPSSPHQGPRVPVGSSGMSSGQSYLSHPQPPPVNVSSKISHPHPIPEQHFSPWMQNVHQLPPKASLPGPSAYPPPSLERHILERGPPCQTSSHAPPSPPPPYSSSSSLTTSDPFGSYLLSMQQHSYPQPRGGPLLPLPPPPPPPSSPPGVPPLPPSSPPSDFLSKNVSQSSKDLLEGNTMKSGCPPQVRPDECRTVHQIDVSYQHNQENGPKMDPADAVVAHTSNAVSAELLTDSDMDMEDDITHPHEEKNSCLSNSTDDECISVSQEAPVKSHLQALQHTGGRRLPKLFSEASVTKDQSAGSDVASGCDYSVNRKVSSEVDDSGMKETGQSEQLLNDRVKESSSRHENCSQPSLPVISAESGSGKLSDQLMEVADPFKLLQGYASDNTSENDGENLLGDVIPPSTNDGSANAEKGFTFESNLRCKSLAESIKHIPSKPITESLKNVIEAEKSYFASGIVEEFSHKSNSGKESVSVGTSVAFQSKDSSGNCNANTGPEGANYHKPATESNTTKPNVDEFGRLIREGVSDSDTSYSPRYTRRHARRARKRSSSQSRSRSPHDRRRKRRRSPWRRKERRRPSRSLSPKRRLSRSRTPVLRRDSEFSGDKWRSEKGQLPECFDFRRGKCYRGASCRYSHHESDKSERLRYNQGKQQYGDKPPSLHISDYLESKVFTDKEMKDKGPKPSQGSPGLRGAGDAKELQVDSSASYADKLNILDSRSPADVVASNLSGYSAHDVASGKEKSSNPECPAQYTDKTPQTVDQQGERMDHSVIPESSSLLQASGPTSTHIPADKPDAKQGPTSQLLSTESPMMNPYCNVEVPSQSLKELSSPITNHPSQLTNPLPSSSQVMSGPFAQSVTQDYNLMPPSAGFQSTSGNYLFYQAPVPYQHSHFPGPSNSLPSSCLPLPPPPPPPPQQHSHLSHNVTTGESSTASQHLQQSLFPPQNGLSSYTSIRGQPTEITNRSQSGQYQGYHLTREPNQMLHTTDNFGSSSLYVSNPTTGQSGLHITGEDRSTGHPVQGMNPLPSFAQVQPYPLLMHSASKGLHSSLGGGLPSNSNSSHGRLHFQPASHGLQYSDPAGVPAQLAQHAKMSSSMSGITPDILERNHYSYVHDALGSTISSHFDPYASTFNLPLNSKFSPNAFIQEKSTAMNSKFSSSFPIDEHKIGSVDSKIMISSLGSGLAAESVLPRSSGDQYDPLFDSIEPASNSSHRADEKGETTGDSDMQRFYMSKRLLNMEGTDQEGRTAVSANDSLDIEECGETADVEVGAVLNGSPSDPNDGTDMNAGEIEIDQVKVSGKKKGKESRMKLFKMSIAAFVKEVLKPSWRQGNMSKEAFKTIVKKTVDKVSGAMKSHKIPKSQAKINHYIDSSRGKLTKLVMGYVDKYVKA